MFSIGKGGDLNYKIIVLYSTPWDLYNGISYAQNGWVMNEKLMLKVSYLWIFVEEKKRLDPVFVKYQVWDVYIYEKSLERWLND